MSFMSRDRERRERPFTDSNELLQAVSAVVNFFFIISGGAKIHCIYFAGRQIEGVTFYLPKNSSTGTVDT